MLPLCENRSRRETRVSIFCHLQWKILQEETGWSTYYRTPFTVCVTMKKITGGDGLIYITLFYLQEIVASHAATQLGKTKSINFHKYISACYLQKLNLNQHTNQIQPTLRLSLTTEDLISSSVFSWVILRGTPSEISSVSWMWGLSMRMKGALHFSLIVCRVSPSPTMYISSHGRPSTIGLPLARAVINNMANQKKKFKDSDRLFAAAAMIIGNIYVDRKQRICRKKRKKKV